MEDPEGFAALTEARGRARIIAHPRSGGELDVTEDLVSILDALMQTMDWSSGFLNREDVEAVDKLTALLKFNIDEKQQQRWEEERKAREQAERDEEEWRRLRPIREAERDRLAAEAQRQMTTRLSQAAAILYKERQNKTTIDDAGDFAVWRSCLEAAADAYNADLTGRADSADSL